MGWLKGRPDSGTAWRRENPTGPAITAAFSFASNVPDTSLQRPEQGGGKLMRPRTVRITIGMIIWAVCFFGLAMLAGGAIAGMV